MDIQTLLDSIGLRGALEILNALQAALAVFGASWSLWAAAFDLAWYYRGGRTRVEECFIKASFASAGLVFVLSLFMAFLAVVAILTPNPPQLTPMAAMAFVIYMAVQAAVGLLGAIDRWLRAALYQASPSWFDRRRDGK